MGSQGPHHHQHHPLLQTPKVTLTLTLLLLITLTSSTTSAQFIMASYGEVCVENDPLAPRKTCDNARGLDCSYNEGLGRLACDCYGSFVHDPASNECRKRIGARCLPARNEQILMSRSWNDKCQETADCLEGRCTEVNRPQPQPPRPRPPPPTPQPQPVRDGKQLQPKPSPPVKTLTPQGPKFQPYPGFPAYPPKYPGSFYPGGRHQQQLGSYPKFPFPQPPKKKPNYGWAKPNSLRAGPIIFPF